MQKISWDTFHKALQEILRSNEYSRTADQYDIVPKFNYAMIHPSTQCIQLRRAELEDYLMILEFLESFYT